MTIAKIVRRSAERQFTVAMVIVFLTEGEEEEDDQEKSVEAETA